MRLLKIVISSFGLSVLATPSKRANGVQVVTQCLTPGTAALTFDDGPSPFIRQVSDALTAAGGHATFFLNGQNWYCIYDQDKVDGVRYALEHGHQIASHTWSHPHLRTLNREAITFQFSKIDEAIERVSGVLPAFMRPPYGEFNDDVLAVAAQRGQMIVIWDFDSGDAIPVTVNESIQLYDDVVAKHPFSILSLGHDVHQSTVDSVLPHAIDILKKVGYRLVTVAECVGQAPYQRVGQYGVRNDSWTCN